MSQVYDRSGRDPLALVPFSEAVLDAAVQAARNGARKRHMVRFHDFKEPVQRMLNAVEPGSYVRPHRHADPDKPEAFVALRGSVVVVRFDDNGTPLEGVLVSADGPVRGAEVPPGAWHTFVALRSGTVLFEVTQGPYDAVTNKQFASWAPPEDDSRATIAYLAELRRYFEPLMPEVAAINQIEAEDDEIY